MPVQLSENIQALVLGKQGSGKSLLARCALATEVVLDTRDFYISISTKPDHYVVQPAIRGPNVEISLEKLGFWHVPLTPDKMDKIKKFRLEPFLEKSPKLAITIMGLAPEQRKDVLNQIATDILNLGSAVVLIDEADRLIPARRETPEEMLNLIRQGRYKGVNIWLISHSDTSVHIEIPQESNMIIAFCMVHPTRVERLRHVFSDPRLLTQLRRYEYLATYEVNGEEWLGFSTYDLLQLLRLYPEAFDDPQTASEYLERACAEYNQDRR